jgi:4-oxalocrotonate tautomerase family enzyme
MGGKEAEMPVITVQVIKGVVLTSDEQKRELLQKITDAFIGVVGEVARPYTYVIIQETPLYEWSIGGRPLPDLPFLYGPEYAEMHHKANEIMRNYVESQAPASAPKTEDELAKAKRAEDLWSGG